MDGGFPTEDDQPVCSLDDDKDAPYRSEQDSKFIQLLEASGYDLSKRTELAMAAGFNPRKVATENASRIIKSMTRNVAMQRALKRKKVDFNRLADKLAELLDCEHPAFEGKPDNMSQLKALELGFRVHDAFPATKVDIDKTERKELILSAEVVQRLEKMEKLKTIDVRAVTVDNAPD